MINKIKNVAIAFFIFNHYQISLKYDSTKNNVNDIF